MSRYGCLEDDIGFKYFSKNDIDLSHISRRTLITVGLRKIENQFPHKKPNCPVAGESKLMFTVLSLAAYDLLDKNYRGRAIRYFNEGSENAEICGVDQMWVKEVLEKCFAFLPINASIPVVGKNDQ